MYAALTFVAAGNALDANIGVGAGRTLRKPLLVVRGVTAYPATVRLNGATLVRDTDYFPSLRAGARQHADANVLALGALEIGTANAEEILMAFLAATFEGGRHARRVAGIMDVERRGISREAARA